MFLDEASKKQNFRQVGTKTTGHIKKGPGIARRQCNADIPRASSSIPSKFETILNTGDRESNAFGCRTNRFGEVENELPGPGAYHKPPSMVVTHATSGSVSKKGMGTGFVSKVKRFEESHPCNAVPGPGQYSSRLIEKASFNRRIGLSSFAPVERPNNQTSASSVPGPGQYEYSTKLADSHVEKGNRSAFVSKTHRGFAPRVDGPAPGQYENVLALAREVSRHQSHAQGIFKSNVRRVETPKAAVPGPGAYGVEEAELCLHNDTVAKAQASSMFKCGGADRFGRPLERRIEVLDVPGPGAYTSSVSGTTTAPAASSAFKSSVKRGQLDKSSRAPGPAFYKPSSPLKKSHLLNGTKKWL